MTTKVEKSMLVNVPVRTALNDDRLAAAAAVSVGAAASAAKKSNNVANPPDNTFGQPSDAK